MKRTFARVALTLLATPVLAATVAGTAHAGSVTIPGCYGATSNGIVCNPTVSYGVPLGVDTYEETIPVCAGTCVDVPVTLVRTAPGEPLLVCASWTDRAGNPASRCVDDGDVDSTIATVDALADSVRESTANDVESLQYLCDVAEGVRCPIVVYNVIRIVAEALRP